MGIIIVFAHVDLLKLNTFISISNHQGPNIFYLHKFRSSYRFFQSKFLLYIYIDRLEINQHYKRKRRIC